MYLCAFLDLSDLICDSPMGFAMYRLGNAARDVQVTQWFAIPGPMIVGDLSSRHQRFEDFFDKERIAIGQGVDGIQKRRLRWTLEIKDGLQHRTGLAAGEAGKRDLLPEVLSVELGQLV